jgi:GTP-binding protein YchF
MTLQCGIMGLPNVGKSTLFNALTTNEIAAENYPFCTIEPNTGVVAVPDERLAALAAISKSEKIVATAFEFVDIAGLVRGASQGEGLGNQFLSHIREVDAIAHVVRCFEDENVVHVEGHVDPLRDVETIETELGLADLDTLQKRLDRTRKGAKSGDKEMRAAAAFLEALLGHVGDGKPARTFPVPAGQRAVFRDCHLLTGKPILYVANVDEASLAEGNATSAALEAWAHEQGAGTVRLCGKIEAELATLEEGERREFMEELGVKEPGLHRLIRAAYELLGLVTFLTTGPQETRAWTVRAGTSAPAAAGTIHSDFESKFIRAEVTRFGDFVAAGSEAEAKARGKTRIEGKDYVIRDGDVVYFRTGA